MRLATVLTRVLGSGVFVAGAAIFLWTFGPRPETVHADIYAPLASAAGFLRPPGGEGTAIREGRVLVNGAAFNYVTGHSRLPLSRVLSHYEAQFETVASSGGKLSSATRIEANGAGAVAGMRFGKVVHPSDVVSRFAAMGGTGKLGALDFHLVSAYSYQRGTVFIDFTPAPDASLHTLLPPSGGDAPGDDPFGVSRPAGLQRLFTIEHGTGGDKSRTLIYRATNSRKALDAFRRSFVAAGWSSNPDLQTTETGHFTDGQRECLIAGAGNGADAVVVLVGREFLQGGIKK
jgi:hypothetical protein